ncbi:LacI family DNA-binding transcriptional regulator [Orbus mooreae]|uniref:LacI family DNA-binding transcriptional regulator n=1 Tax=Orbus mooreae TaxID=3074107 RepID=UPI00370D4B21
MPNSKITLTKIAKKAGVSVTSVSRVVHAPHLTSRETQERVHQAIGLLGFNASVFKPYSQLPYSKKILIIDNQLITGSLINKGIESKAKELGYKLLYLRFFYFNEQEIQQIISYTINHQVDGILLINDSPYLLALQQYQHALPPIVLVNHFSLYFPCVYFDHLSNAYQATQYLTDKGHRKIAILLGSLDKDETQHLVQGYQQALKRLNSLSSDNYMVYDCINYSASYKALKRLMQLPFPPTAIICCDHLNLNYIDREKLFVDDKFDETISTDSAICGVIDQCRIMNINIPADLSLVQFIHHKGHKPYSPLNHICAVYKPLVEMGEEAISLLLNLQHPDYRGNNKRLISTEISNRHSTATLL